MRGSGPQLEQQQQHTCPQIPSPTHLMVGSSMSWMMELSPWVSSVSK